MHDRTWKNKWTWKRWDRNTAKKYKQIEAIYLFGSCAKGIDNTDSDIDTLIIWKDFDGIEKEGLNTANFVEEVFKQKAFNWDRLWFNSYNEFKQNNYGVYKEILQLNKIIYEKEY